jgi:hypothetical protein
MGYKWKPSKTARREFAEKMNNDVEFAEAYRQRRQQRAEKRRGTSTFDYEKAGGEYIPTKYQNDRAFEFLTGYNLTPEQKNACNQVLYGFSCSEKIHHDNIHIVNELIRTT